MSTKRIVAQCIWAVVPFLASTLEAQDAPARMTTPLLLRIRHPEVVESPAFRAWADDKAVGRWSESARVASGARDILIQDTSGARLFAAQVSAARTILRTATVDLEAMSFTRENALLMANGAKASSERLVGLEPAVTWGAGNKVDVDWLFDVLNQSGLSKRFRLEQAGKTPTLESTKSIEPLRTRPPAEEIRDRMPGPSRGGAEVGVPAMPRGRSGSASNPPEELSGDELHDLAAFAREADSLASGATSVQEKARRVYEYMNASYRYVDGIDGIGEFTWADVLTRDLNQRAGICDEWSVVEVTLLRAMGIPARMRLLVWRNGRAVEGHATVEYMDGSRWRHLDPLYKAFNDPTVYRRYGVSDLTVMDASQPLDSRSTAPAWGLADLAGDRKLYPYGDFVITPAYPGKKLPGYSY